MGIYPQKRYGNSVTKRNVDRHSPKLYVAFASLREHGIKRFPAAWGEPGKVGIYWLSEPHITVFSSLDSIRFE